MVNILRPLRHHPSIVQICYVTYRQNVFSIDFNGMKGEMGYFHKILAILRQTIDE